MTFSQRSVTTITISMVFLTLMITGILLYALPWNYLIGSIHIWASLFFIVGTILHFKNNLKVYLNHLKNKVGKKTFSSIGFVFLMVVVGLMFGVPPFNSLINLSEHLKAANQPVTSEYTVLDLTANPDLPKLSLFMKAGESYVSEPQPIFLNISYTSIPQVAVWIETMDGQYIDTLYVTGKSANSNFGSEDGELVRRPEALPYWSFSRGIQEEDGYFAPSINNADLDGVTGATPLNDSLIALTAPKMGSYRLMLEVNRSYDFNEYYSKDRFPEDATYSGSGSSGQPSLIYSVDIDSNSSGKYLMELIGHGHHSGQDGKLYTDMSGITTAKELLSFIVVELD